MPTCQQIGDWFRTNVEQRVAQFLQNLLQTCNQTSQWVNAVVQRLEQTARQMAQQCRQQECNWWCLCCNKWFCWLAVLLLLIVRWTIQAGYWLFNLICKLLVLLITIIVITIVQLLKWVVLAVVCLLVSFCALILLVIGLALIGVLLCLVALPEPTLVPLAMAVLPIALPVFLVALALARWLCEVSRCRLLRVIAWALKWSITLGAIISVIFLSPLSAMVVAILGGCIAALIVVMGQMNCPVPRMFSVP